jgi:hypothetical protein
MNTTRLLLLFVLPIPIACITWTVTHEELFREPRDWFAAKSRSARSLYSRKFFYVFTCEYCFSHYVTAFFLFITRYTLLFDDWRGYLISGFSLVWLANVYMSFFGRLRLEIQEDRLAVDAGVPATHRPPHGSKDTIREVEDPPEARGPIATE